MTLRGLLEQWLFGQSRTDQTLLLLLMYIMSVLASALALLRYCVYRLLLLFRLHWFMILYSCVLNDAAAWFDKRVKLTKSAILQ